MKYIKRMGLKVVMEKLKKHLVAKKAKMIRDDQRIDTSRVVYSEQIRMILQRNAWIVYYENLMSDNIESQRFQSDIWSKDKEQKTYAAWLQEMRHTVVCSNRHCTRNRQFHKDVEYKTDIENMVISNGNSFKLGNVGSNLYCSRASLKNQLRQIQNKQHIRKR